MLAVEKRLHLRLPSGKLLIRIKNLNSFGNLNRESQSKPIYPKRDDRVEV
jgi:hypothetical protein